MNFFMWLGRVVTAWVALLAVEIIAGLIVPIHVPVLPHAFLWFALNTFIIAAVVSFAAVRSEWRGMRLGFALAAIPFFAGVANDIEGAVFLGSSGISWMRLLLHLTLSFLLVAPLWGWGFTGLATGSNNYHPVRSRRVGQFAARFVAADIAYVVLYFAAGLIIFPFVRDFYATQTVPSAGKIVALQMLVRAPIFIAICLLLVRMFNLTRWNSALAVGAVFHHQRCGPAVDAQSVLSGRGALGPHRRSNGRQFPAGSAGGVDVEQGKFQI
jgi:hypothetical protein